MGAKAHTLGCAPPDRRGNSPWLGKQLGQRNKIRAPAIIAGLTLILCTILSLGLSLGLSSGASAMGGGSSQSAAPRCPSGQYFSQRCSECAKRCRTGYFWACGRGCVQRSSMILEDRELYSDAISLIRSEHYPEALDLLWAIKDQHDPKVLNYIGFSRPKARRPEDRDQILHQGAGDRSQLQSGARIFGRRLSAVR